MCFMLVRVLLRRKPRDAHSRNCRFGRCGEGSDQALMGAGKLGSALDQEHRELAERIQID